MDAPDPSQVQEPGSDSGCPQQLHGVEGVDAMSSSVVKVNGVEVTSDASKPTVINININQPSSLYSLIESTRSAWKGRKTAKDGAKAAAAPKDGSNASVAPFRAEQKVLGAVQIMNGLVCLSIAVLFCFIQRSQVFWSGSGFWTGIPFILAGVVVIVGEKRGNCCWLSAASLMNCISLAVAIAGIVMISNDLGWPWWNWDPVNICNSKNNDYYGRSYYRTTTPEPRNWRMEECKDVLSRLLNLYFGMKIMMLVTTCLALCISLYSLGFGCKTLCCALASEQEEEVSTVENIKEPLLTSQPPPYAEKLPKVETV